MIIENGKMERERERERATDDTYYDYKPNSFFFFFLIINELFIELFDHLLLFDFVFSFFV